MKLSGFRVGKTPYDLIATNYTSEALECVINNAIDHCSSNLIKKIEVKSHLYPKVDVMKKENVEDNFVYKFSFESMPEVPMIDLEK